MRRSITVEASIDIDDLLDGLDAADLAELGLYREKETPPIASRLRALADAVNGGNDARRDEIIKELCWDMGGVMAYPPLKQSATK